MARARNIKPGLYKNEDLAECSVWARYIFPGMWMLADREGRLEDRPKRIKGELLPYDSIEVEPLLVELSGKGFIVRYEVDGQRYIQIAKFSEHQAPHVREQASTIPAPACSEQATTKEVIKHCLGCAESSPRSPDCGLPLTSSLNPSSPIEAIASKKPLAQKKRTQLPDDFYPNETGIRLAEESKVSVAIELQAFANHHKAKGSLMADWQAAWRTWVGNSVKFGNARASPAFKTIHDQRAETIAALTGRNRNERTTANERDITGEAIRVA